MVMVVPAVGKPGCPCCNVSSCAGVMFVTGWASDITAMSFVGGYMPDAPVWRRKSRKPLKLLTASPRSPMRLGSGMNDTPVRFMMGRPGGTPGGLRSLSLYRQWAAVRTVRELMSEPVQPEIVDEPSWLGTRSDPTL